MVAYTLPLRPLLPWAVAVCVLFFILTSLEKEDIVFLFKHISYIHILVAILCITISQVICAFRFYHYAVAYGAAIILTDALRIYFKGIFFSIFLPGGVGGDAYRGTILHRHYGISVSHALRCCIAERASGLLALLTIGICFLALLLRDQWILSDTYRLFMIAQLCLLMGSCYILGVKKVTAEGISVSLKAMPYSFTAQLMQYVGFFACAFAIPGEVDAAVYGSLFAASSFAAMIPISVAGVGLREAVFLYGSVLFPHIESESAVFSTLLFFLCSLPSVCIGAYEYIRKTSSYFIAANNIEDDNCS